MADKNVKGAEFLKSNDSINGEIIMSIKDKLNKVSDKVDLFPELSLYDKLQNRLIVFGVNIFNWIKNIFYVFITSH